ncbi:hypothetical protein YC2023_042397 [Brassica napus]
MRENELVKELDDVAEAIVYRHFTLRFMRNLQKWIGFGPEKKMVEANATIDRVCAKYISAKRDEIQQGTSRREDVLTFFIKLDTTKTGCDQENLDKLVYLHATLYETMRLYPPAPFQRKTSIKPDMLPSGHKVDANFTVIFFLYAMGG